jgi:ribose 5-phosphate isomerase
MTRAAGARRSAPATAAQAMEKRAAAERAAGLVRPGMIVGLGSGTTAGFVLGYLAARLGRGELPEVVGIPTSTTVEVVEFGWRPEAAYLESLGAEVSLRRAGDGSLFHTDQGNLILDADLGPIDDPATLAGRLLARAGVAEVGLFCGLTSDLIIAPRAGVEHRTSHDKEQR